jgi:hypothetical protein
VTTRKFAIPSPTASLFHTPTGIGFIDIDLDGHRKNLAASQEVAECAWIRREELSASFDRLCLAARIKTLDAMMEADAEVACRRSTLADDGLKAAMVGAHIQIASGGAHPRREF